MPVSEIPYRYQINFDDGDQFGGQGLGFGWGFSPEESLIWGLFWEFSGISPEKISIWMGGSKTFSVMWQLRRVKCIDLSPSLGGP